MVKSFIAFIYASLLYILPAHAEKPACLTANVFRAFKRCSSFEELSTKAGKSVKDIGSGIHIFVYPLCDGSEVLVGTPNKIEVFYIKLERDGKILEEILPPLTQGIPCP